MVELGCSGPVDKERGGVRRWGWILGAAVLAGCGSSVELQSQWLDRSIDVDGVLYEWTDNFLILYKHDIDVGVFNDEEFLYLSFGSGSHEVQTQIDERGLIVWFDPTGEKKRDFGIKFPLGWQSLVDLPEDMPPSSDLPEDLVQARDEARQTALADLEFLVGGETAFRVGAGTTSGVEASVRSAGAAFSYELRVPLRVTEEFPYAVGVEPGVELMVGFETPESEHPLPSPNPEPMRRPSGSSTMPGTIDTPPPMGLPLEKRLEAWLSVQLAPGR